MSVSAYAADAETYLYNGVELPALPDWDKEKYPYATICDWSADVGAGFYALTAFAEPAFRDGVVLAYDGAALFPKSGGWQTWFCCLDANTAVGEGGVPVGEWFEPWSHPGEDGNYWLEVLVWTNHDVLDNHGAVYLAASDPVPTQPKYSPTLISRTYSFTDTTVITEVTLMGLDPAKTYKVYWAIYDAADNLLGHGVSSQIGDITGVKTATGFSRIVNLLPGSFYDIYWHLIEDDLVLDSGSNNTVTTLGLAPGGSETPGGSGGMGSETPGGSGGTGSDFAGGEDDISGSQGDGNTGILMQILNKLSAIFDFLTGDKEVEDTPEQAVKDATSDVTQAVADTIFGENSTIKPTVDTVTDVASIGSSVKSFFTTGVSVGDFFDLFNDSSLTSWFSEETAADLNSVPSVATFGIDDAMTESERIYFEKRARLYAFAGIGGVD